MPQVGVNNEPLLERAVFGYDGSDYRVIKIDTTGQLLIAVADPVDNPVGLNGWVSAAWQKAPIPFGMSASIFRNWSNTALPTGASDQDDSAVPTGENWVITNIAAAYVGTTTSVLLRFQVVRSSTAYTLAEFRGLTTARYESWQGQLYLEPGDKLRVRVSGAVLNDDLLVDAVGYRIDIDQ